MTVAPNASPTQRMVVSALLSGLLLVLGVLALVEYGAGAALFLFALAAVGVVDLALLVQRRARPR
jgi:hypothetical protein